LSEKFPGKRAVNQEVAITVVESIKQAFSQFNRTNKQSGNKTSNQERKGKKMIITTMKNNDNK